jgi:hypothetical protein
MQLGLQVLQLFQLVAHEWLLSLIPCRGLVAMARIQTLCGMIVRRSVFKQSSDQACEARIGLNLLCISRRDSVTLTPPFLAPQVVADQPPDLPERLETLPSRCQAIVVREA